MATAVSTTSASDVKGQIQILEQPSYMAGHADHRQHTEHSHGKTGWRSTSNDMYGYTYIYICVWCGFLCQLCTVTNCLIATPGHALPSCWHLKEPLMPQPHFSRCIPFVQRQTHSWTGLFWLHTVKFPLEIPLAPRLPNLLASWPGSNFTSPFFAPPPPHPIVFCTPTETKSISPQGLILDQDSRAEALLREVWS